MGHVVIFEPYQLPQVEGIVFGKALQRFNTDEIQDWRRCPEVNAIVFMGELEFIFEEDVLKEG